MEEFMNAVKAKGGGTFHFEHLRDGVKIDAWDSKNIYVNEGINYTLNTALGGGAAITSWYLGLFSGNYTPQATDAAATIASNSTETTQYTAGSRQSFTPAAASGQSITNSATRATFTFNASTTVYGMFLVSSSAISGTTGTLFSAAQFPASKPVTSGDQLLVTYTFSLASA
jgi:hypothetical protein